MLVSMSTTAARSAGSSLDVVVAVLAGGAVTAMLELDVSTDVDRSAGCFTADTMALLTWSVDVC